MFSVECFKARDQYTAWILDYKNIGLPDRGLILGFQGASERFECLVPTTLYMVVSLYVRCARHYKPRLVYFLPHLGRSFLCFQGGLFQEILSLCMVSILERFLIKSGL